MNTTKKPTAHRLLAEVLSRPWCVRPEVLARVLPILFREGPGREAVELELGRPLANSYAGATMRGDVAVLPIRGPIFRYANMFTAISGGVSLDLLALDLGRLFDDPAVSSIVLELDSPGGEAVGIHELAQAIRARSSSKPIVAYVGGDGCSAAYWLAAACDEIVVDATAMLGSIGVVFCVPKPNPMTATEIEIVSSQSPKKRPDVTTPGGVADVRAIADALCSVFVADVAELRGIGDKRVLDLQGGVRIGADAVSAGLADRLGSLEGLLAELATGTNGSTPSAFARRAQQKGKTKMMNRPARRLDNVAPPAPPTDGAPKYSKGDRVVAREDRGDVKAGTHGAVDEVRPGAQVAYGVLFDGQAEVSRWWLEEELDPESAATNAASKLRWRGKAWTELRPSEKASLYQENHALYQAMKAGTPSAAPSAARSTDVLWKGKAWSQLKPMEKAELHQVDHARYQAMKAANV